MSESQPVPKRQPDPVSEAIAFPFKNFSTLMRIALIPWIITVVLFYTFSELLPRLTRPLFPTLIISKDRSGDYDLFHLIPDLIETPISIIYYMFFAVFAVSIHRMIILGERPGWLIYRFGRHELAYSIAFLVVSALLWGPILLFDLTVTSSGTQYASWQHVVQFIYFIAWCILALRLLLIYPHAAVTGRLSFTSAWMAMKDRFWSIFATLIIFELLIAVVTFIFLAPVMWFVFQQYKEYFRGNSWIVTVLNTSFTALGLLYVAMTVALVSFLYRESSIAKEGTRSEKAPGLYS